MSDKDIGNSSSSGIKEDPQKPSMFEVAVVSGGALSAGFVVGVWYQFRKSKFKFDIRQHHNELKFAGKAFLAGTALCFGTFGVLTSAFMYTTGISSFLEFSYFMKTKFQGKAITGPSEEMKKETKILEGMTKEQEWEYWTNKFNHYWEGDENPSEKDVTNSASDVGPNVDVKRILEIIDDEDDGGSKN